MPRARLHPPPKPTDLDDAFRSAARELYGDDTIDIDDDAMVVPVGLTPVAWVQAWVRVSWEDVEQARAQRKEDDRDE